MSNTIMSQAMIRAVFRDGVIQPVDDVPADWHDGDELCVLPSRRPMPAKRKYSVEDVRAILKPQGPPPDDATIKRWIDEHRVEKYGQ